MSKTFIVPTNAEMKYVVSKDGYNTISGKILVDSDKVIDIVLEEKPIDVYTFNTTEDVDTFIAENCVVHNASECGIPGFGGDDEFIEDSEQL